jgi:hypothetical protein
MKIKFLLLCFYFISMLHKSEAQWVQIGYMVSGNDTANGSHVIKAFGNDLYCGTNRGLFRSQDNGDNWTSITYTAPVIQNQDIFSIFKASNGDLFCGSNQRMFKSIDNGNTWQWLSVLPDSATYYDITEMGANILVSCVKGTFYAVYYSNDFGNTWTAANGITSGVRYFLIDGNDLFLGGTTAGVYRSQNLGMAWNTVGLGLPTNPGIWGITRLANKLFANSLNGNGLWESADGGMNWTETSPPEFSGFCQVFSVVEANGIMLASMDGSGCNTGQVESIKLSSDTGTSWNAFLTGITPPNYLPILGKNANGTNFFTKRGNGKQVFRTDVTTLLQENKSTIVAVNPNPSNGNFRVNVGAEKLFQLQVFDLNGRLLLQQLNQYELNLSHLSKGIYLLKVFLKDGLMEKKIIVE